jgi:signal transduction histidine kinase
MRLPHQRAGSASWPRLPRRTARLRLTALYGGLFLLCGVVLLAITYLLVQRAIGHGADITDLATASQAHARQPEVVVKRPLHQIQVAAARQQIAFDLRQLLIQSGIALAVVAVIAVVLGWLVAGRVLRPLATITATARKISASTLHERLALHGPDDELKDLGDTLDALFARLEASFEAQRHFVSNASHELRTPSPRSAPCSRSRSMTPAPAPKRGGPPAAKSSRPTPSRNASSTRCSRWPAAKVASTTASPSTCRAS